MIHIIVTIILCLPFFLCAYMVAPCSVATYHQLPVHRPTYSVHSTARLCLPFWMGALWRVTSWCKLATGPGAQPLRKNTRCPTAENVARASPTRPMSARPMHILQRCHPKKDWWEKGERWELLMGRWQDFQIATPFGWWAFTIWWSDHQGTRLSKMIFLALRFVFFLHSVGNAVDSMADMICHFFFA